MHTTFYSTQVKINNITIQYATHITSEIVIKIFDSFN